LWTVIDQAESTSLLQEAEEALAEVETARDVRLEELVREAEWAKRGEPENVARERAAWEAVQSVDPANSRALNALSRLAERERLEVQLRCIKELRVPLGDVRKDIAAVEKARLEAQEMRLSGEVTDTDLRQRLEETYQQLDELRDEILRASEGGASSERAQDFEKAIETYRAALRAGYDVIAGDTTGEPINVAEALERTLQAYWFDLRERSSRRYNEAQRALKDGYPETAVNLLKEAQDLMRKVEEGGEEIRTQVDEALAHAQEALKNKQEAQRLVAEAEEARDPHEARVRLVEAKQHYPRYPDLEKMIADKERLVLAQVARQAAADLSAARGKVLLEEFDEAREHCRTALQRGANLTTTYDALVARWEEVQALLEEIDRQAAKHHELLAKLSRIDEALEREEVRLAHNLMARLTEEEQGALETLPRRLRLADLVEGHEKYAEAERFFYREQDYERVIEVCRELQDSADFRERAGTLRRRAEARLSLSQARQAYQQGDLNDAIAGYRRVEGLANTLPKEDQQLVEEAATLLKAWRDLCEARAYLGRGMTDTETDRLLLGVLSLPYETQIARDLKEQARRLPGDQNLRQGDYESYARRMEELLLRNPYDEETRRRWEWAKMKQRRTERASMRRKYHQERLADLRTHARVLFWVSVGTAVTLLGVAIYVILTVINRDNPLSYLTLLSSLMPVLAKPIYDQSTAAQERADKVRQEMETDAEEDRRAEQEEFYDLLPRVSATEGEHDAEPVVPPNPK
jgi:hypothetical protein